MNDMLNGSSDQSPPFKPAMTPASLRYEASEELPPAPLLQALNDLRRHWWKVLAFALCCALGTYFICRRITPIYEATTTIDVDRQAPPGIIGQDAKRPDVDTDYDQVLATQVKIIQSDSVLRPVALKYNLLEKEGQRAAGSSSSSAHEDSPVVLKSLYVTRPANTFLLQVSYRSTDPRLAANVANAVANSYIEHMFKTRVEASARLSSFMDKELEELKVKVDKSGVALARFEGDMNFINPEERTTMLSARLMQMNVEYTAAQADRVKKLAAYESARGHTLETALIASQGDALRRLVERENEAEEKFVQVKQHYNITHPEYLKAAAQVNELQRQMEVTQVSLIGRAQAEYQEAVAREKMLEGAVAGVRGEYNQLNSKSFEYQQLKREAEGDKKLYDELIRRIREASINANFESDAIRLSDLARPAEIPVSPRIKQDTLLAFLIASLAAAGFILLSEKFSTTIHRSEQVSQSLATNVIGILPEVKAWRLKTADHGAEMLIPMERESQLRPWTEQTKAVASFDESIRTLRNSILLSNRERMIRTVLITSAATGEGKSTTALHLAIAHAAHGLRTLLIDADLRRPTLHHRLNLAVKEGLSHVLTGGRSIAAVVIPVDGHPNLDFIPAGEPSRLASDLVGQRIESTLEFIGSQYDLIVVDGPPFLGIAESLRLASTVDSVVVIARMGRTGQASLELVLRNLRQLRANVSGVVLNHAAASLGQIYGTYR